MNLPRLKSLGWSPTIAVSWFWGLGFFYSIHVYLVNGIVGFLAFAIPNSAGLAIFGTVLQKRRGRIAQIVDSTGNRYTLLFLACQILAISITIFSLYSFAAKILLTQSPEFFVGLITIAACAIAHVVSLHT